MKNKIGIILSSAFCTEELQVLFGKITPSELPLGNKHIFKYQHDFLSSYCDIVFLTQPKDYISRIDYENILSFDHELTLIEVIQQLSSKFKNYSLIILYGDTIIDSDNISLVSKKDFIGLAFHPGFNFNWYEIEDKIFIGLFGLGVDSKIRKKVSQVKSIEKFLGLFNKDNYLNTDLWLDYGHKTTYNFNRIKFLETRGFNNLSFKNGFVTKSSQDWFKMYAEFKWLKDAFQLGYKAIPNVRNFNYLGGKSFYEIEYKNCISLNEKFTFGKFSLEFETKLLKKLFELHRFNYNLSKRSSGDSSFIINKIKERVKDLPTGENFVFCKEISNNVIDYFQNKKQEFGIMHGDLCYSNILYNEIENHFFFIDPRGYLDKKDGFTIFGPINYDLYKLAHSYVFGYDHIVAFLKTFSKAEVMLRLERFIEITSMDKEELLYGVIQLFITMIPLHSDNPLRQREFSLLVEKTYKLL